MTRLEAGIGTGLNQKLNVIGTSSDNYLIESKLKTFDLF